MDKNNVTYKQNIFVIAKTMMQQQKQNNFQSVIVTYNQIWRE